MKALTRAFTASLCTLALSGMVLAAGSAAPAASVTINNAKAPALAALNTQLETHHSGKCLDVADASTSDGAFVQQWECYTTASQNWTFTAVGNGYYTIRADHSDKCLDVAEASIADGGRVQQWDCYASPNQQWRLVQRPNGYFTLVARHSGKCLEIAGGSSYNGAGAIQQMCASDRPYQEWRLV